MYKSAGDLIGEFFRVIFRAPGMVFGLAALAALLSGGLALIQGPDTDLSLLTAPIVGSLLLVALVDRLGLMPRQQVWSRFGHVLLTQFLANLLIFGGTLFFILPGLILAIGLAIAAPLALDPQIKNPLWESLVRINRRAGSVLALGFVCSLPLGALLIIGMAMLLMQDPRALMSGDIDALLAGGSVYLLVFLWVFNVTSSVFTLVLWRGLAGESVFPERASVEVVFD